MRLKSPQTYSYVWQHPDWPRWTFDAKAISVPLAQARLQQGKILGKAHIIGLAYPALQDALIQIGQDIWVHEAIATAAIEGQTLDLDQVRSSVMRQLGIAGAGHASRHINGLVDIMADATQHLSAPLDADRLCRWQAALFPEGLSGISRIEVGQFRTFTDLMQIVSGRPGKEVIHYQAPNAERVPQEMAQFLAWFNEVDGLDGIVRAAIAHWWFEIIHPFEDGNGRVGRALLDRAIAQDSPTVLGAPSALRLYSMSRQLQENRPAYYAALHAASIGGLEITPWIHWFLTQFTAACITSETLIDQTLHKAAYWSSHAAHTFNTRQHKVLQKLLDAGDGGFLGGLTADKYSKITGASKATATRDLADLVQKGALRVRGVGKATKYHVNVPGWGD